MGVCGSSVLLFPKLIKDQMDVFVHGLKQDISKTFHGGCGIYKVLYYNLVVFCSICTYFKLETVGVRGDVCVRTFVG